MKKIVFISRGYPRGHNTSFAFVQTVVQQIADKGIHCIVIAPQTINGRSKGGELRPLKWAEKTKKGSIIDVYQPKYLSLGGFRLFGVQLTTFFRERAVNRTLNKLKLSPDVVYGHFWDCALMAGKYCLSHSVPLIAVTGESTINVRNYFNKNQIKERLPAVSGVISVSTKNTNESMRLELIDENTKLLVAPNAVDTKSFYRSDKKVAKRALGLLEDSFIVSYVGRFSERKGVNRLVKATEMLPEVQLILLGYGGEVQESDRIIVKERVPHEEVVKYLNASDVYCLPTQAEGCCNSIVEAMACGLPVVSSNMEFNDDILDEHNAIRIDPNNIEDISQAIRRLKDDVELRMQMGECAHETAKSLRIDKRIEKILQFIDDVCTE